MIVRHLLPKYSLVGAAAVAAILGVIGCEALETYHILQAATAIPQYGIVVTVWVSAYPDSLSSRGLAALITLSVLLAASECLRIPWSQFGLASGIFRVVGDLSIPLLFRKAWQIHSRPAACLMSLVLGILWPISVLLLVFIETEYLVPLRDVLRLIYAVNALLQSVLITAGSIVLTWIHRESHITHDAGHLALIGYSSLMVPSLLNLLYINLKGVSWLFIPLWSTVLFGINKAWVRVIDRAVDGEHEMVFAFPLQFAEDFFFTLALSSLSFPSVEFFIGLFGFMVRDTLRDIGTIGDIVAWIGKTRPTFEAKAEALTQTCYLGTQNLVSELAACVCMACIASTSAILDSSQVGERYFVQQHEFKSIVPGSWACVVAEVVVHLLVKTLLRFKINKLKAQHAKYLAIVVDVQDAHTSGVGIHVSDTGSLSDEGSHTSTISPPPFLGTVLDPQWDLGQRMHQHFRQNALYLTSVICYVIPFTLMLLIWPAPKLSE